jgi:hypothetical protein
MFSQARAPVAATLVTALAWKDRLLAFGDTHGNVTITVLDTDQVRGSASQPSCIFCLCLRSHALLLPLMRVF